jgi:hypothetical protein
VLDIKKFFLVDHVLHHRLILYWLIKENVKFSVSRAFLDEILRFLSSFRGGRHTVNNAWSIIKKQNKAYIQRL